MASTRSDDPAALPPQGLVPAEAQPPQLSRRALARPEVRAAVALEHEGQRQQAAQVFEYAGEHGRAAALRLEFSRSLGPRAEQLAALREGCARSRGDSSQRRDLHLVLASLLLEEAVASAEGARRRNLQLEAANALARAGKLRRAGELYESLGLLEQAAKTYEASGAIGGLERVLGILEAREQEAEALASLERAVDDALRDGRRAEALTLLDGHLAARSRAGRPAAATLSALETQTQARMLRRDRVDLRSDGGRVTWVHGGEGFAIGRAPTADLSLDGAGLSREHVRIQLAAAGRFGLVAVDQGSKAGTFWDEEALTPGTPAPLATPGALGLGFAATVDVVPLSAEPLAAPTAALLRPTGGGQLGTIHARRRPPHPRTRNRGARHAHLRHGARGPHRRRRDRRVPQSHPAPARCPH